MTARGLGLFVLAVFAAAVAFADGTIDKISKFAWSENSGWQNWRPTNGGVTVVYNGANSYLSGYAWGENIGWVKLGATGAGPYANTGANNYGVNMDAAGRLSGYAWSETCGWVNFSNAYSQVSISSLSFDGFAWAENVGFIHFRNASPAYNVYVVVPSGSVFSIR
jgi:hypothetical protein